MNYPFQHELAIAQEVAREAGDLLRHRRGQVLNVREKGNRSLVTDADLASEALILQRIGEAFPSDSILSEEIGVIGPESGRQWIIDPLDGTTNYSRGLPFFAVSIALWESGEPAVAALYLPVLDELFAATRYTPATLNGEPIRVSTVETVEQAMLNVYFDRHERFEDGLRLFHRLALACEGRVKIMGSTASLLCYVACGRLDGFIKNGTRLWDFAAGALVLRQAGGALTDFAEQPLVQSGQSLLASNTRLHGALATILNEKDFMAANERK